MKKTYLQPATEEIFLTVGNIMITASADGKKIVEDGGNTDGIITEGDSRRSTVWGEEEEEW